jgi:hypothetical protein
MLLVAVLAMALLLALLLRLNPKLADVQCSTHDWPPVSNGRDYVAQVRRRSCEGIHDRSSFYFVYLRRPFATDSNDNLVLEYIADFNGASGDSETPHLSWNRRDALTVRVRHIGPFILERINSLSGITVDYKI